MRVDAIHDVWTPHHKLQDHVCISPMWPILHRFAMLRVHLPQAEEDVGNEIHKQRFDAFNTLWTVYYTEDDPKI